MQASIHNLAPRIGEIAARVVTEGAIWIYAAIVLVIALLWEGRTLVSIGLRKPTFASLGFALAGGAAMVGAGALAGYIVYGLLRQPAHANAQAAALVNGSVVYALCIAVRAGVIEEIFFRGLAIEQLAVLTGSRLLSAFLATAVFVVVHALHFDWIQLVPIAAISIVTGRALFVATRSLGQHSRAYRGRRDRSCYACASDAQTGALTCRSYLVRAGP